jgi:hypothetical protein
LSQASICLVLQKGRDEAPRVADDADERQLDEDLRRRDKLLVVFVSRRGHKQLLRELIATSTPSSKARPCGRRPRDRVVEKHDTIVAQVLLIRKLMLVHDRRVTVRPGVA